MAFYYIADILLVAICIVGYILALLSDKWIMIKLTSPVSTGGIELGLEFFRVLAWDIRIQILTLALVPPAVIDEDYPVWLRVTISIATVVILLIESTKSLKTTFLKKWLNENKNITYDDAKEGFESNYRDEYPFTVW